VLEMIETNWLAFALALLIGILVAVWLFGRAARSGRKRQHRPDVLDEGVAPAQRNQALIDAPSVTAASFAGTGPDILGGMGEIVAVGAAEEAEESVLPPPAAAAPVAAGEGDDLRRIKGVGPKLVSLLHALGVTRYAQIAAWSDEDIDRIDAQLGTFAGRIRRDSWVEQARFLAEGDTTGFEGKFGKL